MLVLTILKWIGIVLLVLLLVVLAVLLLVLFVPIRYSVRGSFLSNVPDGEASVTWLLHLAGVYVSYHAGMPAGAKGDIISESPAVAAGGNADDPEQNAATSIGRTNARAVDPDEGSVLDHVTAEVRVLGCKVLDLIHHEKKDDEGPGHESLPAVPEAKANEGVNTAAKESDQPAEIQKPEDSSDSRKTADSGKATDSELPENVKSEVAANRMEATDRAEIRNRTETRDRAETTGRSVTAEKPEKEAQKEKPAGSLLDRLEDKIYDTFVSVRDRILEKYRDIHATLSALYKVVRQKKDGAAKLLSLFQAEPNRDAVQLLKKKLVRVLKELLPRKGNGSICLGTGDPYGTGQIMQIFAMTYPLWKKHLEVIPEFSEEVHDIRGDLKGAVHLYVVLWAALRIVLTKKLRQMYKQGRVIVEEEILGT